MGVRKSSTHPTGSAAMAGTPRPPRAPYRVGAANCVSSLRMILPPFITNLTR